MCGKGKALPALVQLPTGKAVTVRAAADLFLDSLGSPHTTHHNQEGAGRPAQRRTR